MSHPPRPLLFSLPVMVSAVYMSPKRAHWIYAVCGWSETEPGVYVAHLALGGERHIPQVGHAGAYALIAAHLGSQLLAHHKCRHGAEVGVLYGAHGVERSEQALELG